MTVQGPVKNPQPRRNVTEGGGGIKTCWFSGHVQSQLNPGHTDINGVEHQRARKKKRYITQTLCGRAFARAPEQASVCPCSRTKATTVGQNCGQASDGHYKCPAVYESWKLSSSNQVCVYFIPKKTTVCSTNSLWELNAQYYTNLSFIVPFNQTGLLSNIAEAYISPGNFPESGQEVTIQYDINVSGTSVGGEEVPPGTLLNYPP